MTSITVEVILLMTRLAIRWSYRSMIALGITPETVDILLKRIDRRKRRHKLHFTFRGCWV